MNCETLFLDLDLRNLNRCTCGVALRKGDFVSTNEKFTCNVMIAGKRKTPETITLLGNKHKKPESAQHVIEFPGGAIEVSRTSDGNYWAHILINRSFAVDDCEGFRAKCGEVVGSRIGYSESLEEIQNAAERLPNSSSHKAIMNTPQTATCPCCQNVFDSLDQPQEYARVTAWSAARELGKLSRGHTKSLTPEQRKAKARVLAVNRAKRKPANLGLMNCIDEEGSWK